MSIQDNRGWIWPGARWWRVDLHAHSPKSYDFGSDQDGENPNWKIWVMAASDAGLHVLAVTDHNTADGVNPLQDAASDVCCSPVLFPGVELTASDGSHLLILVDRDREQEHIDDLLSRCEVPVNQRGRQSGRSPLSVEEILKKCGNDALVIGAHVNTCGGLLSNIKGQQRIAVLGNPRLVAVEIDPSRPFEERWLDGSISDIGRPIPKVWASDSHRFDDSGKRFSWVKMTTPNLEGLRLALLDGDASLKLPTPDEPEDPNTAYATLAIESITVCGAKFIGRQCPTAVRFNPWLNAIIGGRGTGKSTLVDFCHMTLRRESDLESSNSVLDEDGSLRSSFNSRMRVPESRSDVGLLTDETLIEVVYRKDGERFVLSWNQEGTVDPIARLEGIERAPQEGDIRERFPVRIYSQKQIFSLAQAPNALLTVIDDSQIVRGTELKRSIEQMADKYLYQRAQARSVWNRAAELPARRADLEDVQHKLDVLQKGGLAQILSEYRVRRQQNDVWREIVNAALEAVKLVKCRATEALSVADLDLADGDHDDPNQAGLRRAYGELKEVVESFRRDVDERAEKTLRDIEVIRTGEDANLWQDAVADSDNRFQEASPQLMRKGVSNPSEYGELLDQAIKLKKEIKDLEAEQERAKNLENDATGTLDEYRRIRSRLHDRRQGFVQETSSEIIRVEIEAFGDQDQEIVSNELRDRLGIEHFESDRRSIAQKILPEEQQKWDWNRLDDVVANMRKFLSGEMDSWETHDHRFKAALRKVLPESIDRLALYLPEDAVRVSFKNGRGGDWQPLPQGSPGQQASALLAFVLGYGSEPIILDQPEDDLDNALIYELLVKRLRETKNNRQVIVVTHNPNIVVHGDAEFVLSLKASKSQTVIACQGGLQERRVREEICEVMEGGEEAFQNRYRRLSMRGGQSP